MKRTECDTEAQISDAALKVIFSAPLNEVNPLNQLPEEIQLVDFDVTEITCVTKMQLDYARELGWTGGFSTVKVAVNIPWGAKMTANFAMKLARYGPIIIIALRRGDDVYQDNLHNLLVKYGWNWVHMSSRFWLDSAMAQFYPNTYWHVPYVVQGSRSIIKTTVEKIDVYPVVKGPYATDVTFYKGRGIGLLLGYENKIPVYVTSIKSWPAEEVKLSMSLATAYITSLAITVTPADLGDPLYYHKHTNSYASWSYPEHHRQLLELLSYIDPSYHIIAPADGIGITARVWSGLKGTGTYGDAAVSEWSHPAMRVDNMQATIIRGLHEAGAKRKILVLSYCAQFFKYDPPDGVFDAILSIEANSHVANNVRSLFKKPALTVGPGLTVIGDVGVIYSNITDFKVSSGIINFSENLLRNEYVFDSLSKYFFYYRAMRPLADINITPEFAMVLKEKIPQKGEPSIYLSATLDSVCNNIKENRTVYFAPAGVIVTKLYRINYILSSPSIIAHMAISLTSLITLAAATPLTLSLPKRQVIVFRKVDITLMAFLGARGWMVEMGDDWARACWCRDVDFTGTFDYFRRDQNQKLTCSITVTTEEPSLRLMVTPVPGALVVSGVVKHTNVLIDVTVRQDFKKVCRDLYPSEKVFNKDAALLLATIVLYLDGPQALLTLFPGQYYVRDKTVYALGGTVPMSYWGLGISDRPVVELRD